MTVHSRQPRGAGSHRLRWWRGDDRGSSTVELTLATPLLVAILLFVVACGRLVTAQIDLDAAASSAARAASLSYTDAGARAHADQAARDTLSARGVTCAAVTVNVDTGGLTPGGAVSVTVSCTVPLSDLLGLGLPGSRVVSATSTAPVDRWRPIGTP